MSKQYLSDLEALNNYEEIFHFTENIVKTECEFDGITIVIHDKKEKKFIVLSEDLQWRDMVVLPESIIKETFEEKSTQIIDEATLHKSFNKSLDCFDENNTSSLLLYPIIDKDEDLDIVFSFWKTFEEEKDQVMQPLIVGSQMIGVTTRVKSTIKHKTFEKENIQFLQEIEETLFTAVKKLMEQIEVQKKVVLSQIENDEQVFKTPQEIIATLINILMGANTSIVNLKDVLYQVKQQVHHNDKLMPHIMLMQEILDSLDENLMNTFQFSTTNNIIEELFKGKETIETKVFFEHFATFGTEIVCQKDLSLNFFLDPRLPSEMKIEKQNTYVFLTDLLSFSFNDADRGAPFNIFVSENQKNISSVFRITYFKEIEDTQIYRNMFIGSSDDTILNDPIYLSYKKFLQTGGKVSTDIDTEKQKISFSITMPYEDNGALPLCNASFNNDIKVGLLLNKEKDLQSANNIARYLLALGISKTQLKGAESINAFKDDLTHLVIFQSQFSKELFEVTLKNKSFHIMLMTNGCSQDQEVTFYDYSMIDYEIDKNRFYLNELEDFIQLESE